MARVLLPIFGLVVLAGVTTSAVFAVAYEGESFCQHAQSWPSGSYLGQMHPFHVDVYRGYAAEVGRDPCDLWALDQRYSAVRGLRELGYTVFGPGEFAWPEPPEPTLAVVAPSAITYQATAGYGQDRGTLDLLPGIHTVAFEFEGWHLGDVMVTATGHDGSPVVVHDGPVHHSGAFTFRAPMAGDYVFEVAAVGDWRLWVGEPPIPVKPDVVTREIEIEIEGDPSVAACEELLFG
ncbi:MAG: hypothetical protein OXG33_11750 [Chloroflexi bacterium]|nr:hypothetical protein [Chloroflexota bacterium]